MGSLQGLNRQPLQAVTQTEGPLLIVAGPGTGKTRTLTARIINLLQEGVKPENVVALTFTNKAAREIKERLKNDENATMPKIATFHALGHDLLQQQNGEVELVNETERQEIIRSIPKSQALKGMGLRELSRSVSYAKSMLEGQPDEAMQRFLAQYEKKLADQQRYDFDDLLIKTYQLLRTDKIKRPNYTHILVDEFQDTSELQYELLKLLGSSRNMCVIGDPNQSIYAFRDAGHEMFERFRRDFSDALEVTLVQNYRSRPEVVVLANAIFPKSPQLRTSNKQSGSVTALQTVNEYSEAAYIMKEIENGIGGSDMLRATGDQTVHEPRDYAILYRTHRAARIIQQAFAESGIPYQIAGEGSPYEGAEIQAIVACMRYAAHLDDSHIERVHQLPALKDYSPARLKSLLVKLSITSYPTVASLASAIAERFAHFPAQDLQQFLNMLIQFGPCAGGLEAALKHIDNLAASEFYDPSINAVSLLTIHAAKGLEFTDVFLCACEEGILPKHGNKLEENLDEERRLFYVACTRARERLDILYTKMRAAKPTAPSRFVAELPGTILPRKLDPNMANVEERLKKKQYKRAQTSLF